MEADLHAANFIGWVVILNRKIASRSPFCRALPPGIIRVVRVKLALIATMTTVDCASMYRIPLIKPHLPGEVVDELRGVIASGYLTEGNNTREFAALARDFLGCKHALAVANCTVGLEAALRCVGVGRGDEVIVPAYTYPATASVCALLGARAVLVDVDPRTMTLKLDALEEAVTDKTRAIMPVSLLGCPLDYSRLRRLCDRFGLFMIEDAACAFGAGMDGVRVGNFADISVFSFHPRKFITTGEGGLVTTARDDFADWLDQYVHFGIKRGADGAIGFELPGTNYKLSNLLAAVGVAQLRIVDAMLERRIGLAERYREKLAAVAGVALPGIPPGGQHSFQTICVFVNERDRIMAAMRERGIEAQIGSIALPRHRAFQDTGTCRRLESYPGMDYAADHCLALPLYHDLTLAEQDEVIEAVKELL